MIASISLGLLCASFGAVVWHAVLMRVVRRRFVSYYLVGVAAGQRIARGETIGLDSDGNLHSFGTVTKDEAGN